MIAIVSLIWLILVTVGTVVFAVAIALVGLRSKMKGWRNFLKTPPTARSS
jgi:hypothetical protein